jgi:DNA-binding response OmpR family regulator
LHPSVQGKRQPTLLLVSGDGDSRIGFTRIARRWHNIKLLLAERGRDGLATAFLERPHLVVLDAQLPDVDGLRAVGALRRNPTTSETPVVVLGVDDSGRELERFYEAGADAYFTRPLNVSQVDRIVLGLLEVAALR